MGYHSVVQGCRITPPVRPPSLASLSLLFSLFFSLRLGTIEGGGGGVPVFEEH
jgi:hypothetical protein